MNDIIVCPKCFGRLSSEKDILSCNTCGLKAAQYNGIADFRVVNPEFSPSESEIEMKDALLTAYPTSSYEELMEIRFNPKGSCDPMTQFQKTFEYKYMLKGTNRAFQINKLLQEHGKSVFTKNLFLDVGCGSGTATPWIMKGFKKGIGIDFSLIDLIIGQKFIEEQGISNFKLVCADVKALPFKDGIFDLTNATDVIEHIVPGQKQFLCEIRRTLKKEGVFYFNSPNRFNIFSPEPHVKIWFVGFMPRTLMHGYVKKIKGLNYRNYNLLSLTELRDLVGKHFSPTYFLTGPFFDLDAPATDFRKKVIKKFPFLLTVINRVLLFFVTGFNVIVLKETE